MAGQTVYAQDPTAGLEGQLVDANLYGSISRTLSDAAGIGAGRFVKPGSAPIDQTCAAFTAPGDFAKALGVTILDLSKMPTTPRNVQFDDIALLYNGVIWMTCVDDMRLASGVVHVCNSGANAGLPQLTAVGGDLAVGVFCLVGGNAGKVGKFRINLVAQ